jgi:predicted ArsR family transcriptional regulator
LGKTGQLDGKMAGFSPIVSGYAGGPGGEPGAGRSQGRSAKVLGALREHGAATSRQLLQATGLTPRQVKYLLSQLVAKGQVAATPADGRSLVYRLAQ